MSHPLLLSSLLLLLQQTEVLSLSFTQRESPCLNRAPTCTSLNLPLLLLTLLEQLHEELLLTTLMHAHKRISVSMRAVL